MRRCFEIGLTVKGGRGSGNYGHGGRPGRVGGSGAGQGAAELEAKLGEAGKVKWPEGAESQFDGDPDKLRIATEGEWFSAKDTFQYPMTDGHCHWNTAKLYERGSVDDVVIGYAKNKYGWHQHTWGLIDGGVVETTPSNFANTKYFGMRLSPKEAKAFVKWTKKNKPGLGRVRSEISGPVEGLKGRLVQELTQEQIDQGLSYRRGDWHPYLNDDNKPKSSSNVARPLATTPTMIELELEIEQIQLL